MISPRERAARLVARDRAAQAEADARNAREAAWGMVTHGAPTVARIAMTQAGHAMGWARAVRAILESGAPSVSLALALSARARQEALGALTAAGARQ